MTENMMYNEIFVQPEVVRKALEQNQPLIRQIVATLRGRTISSIYLVARGTSDHAGIYTKYLGEQMLGIPVCLAASSVINLYQQPLDLSTTLTLAISQSGAGTDVIGVVKDARRQGAITVAITNNEHSSLAQEAQFTLLCHAGVEQSVAATKTCTTSMAVAAALIQEWSGREGHLQQIPEAIAQTLSYFEAIAKKVQPFQTAEHCVVLARGLNYSSALETALKIQETCYLNARGFSTADFQHGPIAMLNPELPVIVYAFHGPALPGIVSLLQRLQAVGCHTLLVTDAPELLELSSDALYFPIQYPEEITPYISVVFGQIFAYHLALAKGNNPDAPRGLHKVTKTL